MVEEDRRRGGRGGGQGPQGSALAQVPVVWGSRSREKRGLALLNRDRLGELELWGGWGDCDHGRMPLGLRGPGCAPHSGGD